MKLTWERIFFLDDKSIQKFGMQTFRLSVLMAIFLFIAAGAAFALLHWQKQTYGSFASASRLFLDQAADSNPMADGLIETTLLTREGHGAILELTRFIMYFTILFGVGTLNYAFAVRRLFILTEENISLRQHQHLE